MFIESEQRMFLGDLAQQRKGAVERAARIPALDQQNLARAMQPVGIRAQRRACGKLRTPSSRLACVPTTTRVSAAPGARGSASSRMRGTRWSMPCHPAASSRAADCSSALLPSITMVSGMPFSLPNTVPGRTERYASHAGSPDPSDAGTGSWAGVCALNASAVARTACKGFHFRPERGKAARAVLRLTGRMAS